MTTKFLLDANVLVALFDNKNANHSLVKKWFSHHIIAQNKVWLSCTITQMACLRILSLPSYPANYSFSDIQQIFDKAIVKTRHQFLTCELDVIQHDIFNWRHLQGHRQLTDAYLLALAVANQAVLLTFDKRIDYHIVKNATQHHLLILDSLE